MFSGHDYGKLLRHQLGFAFAADSGRVDKAIALAFTLHQLVDCVSRGARDGRNDCARCPGKLIQQR